jgi:hypothetical protein
VGPHPGLGVLGAAAAARPGLGAAHLGRGERGFRIEDFRLDNMPARIAKVGDLFAPLLARTARFRLEGLR